MTESTIIFHTHDQNAYKPEISGTAKTSSLEIVG